MCTKCVDDQRRAEAAEHTTDMHSTVDTAPASVVGDGVSDPRVNTGEKPARDPCTDAYYLL